MVALEVPLGLNVARRINSEVKAQARSQAEVVASGANDLIEPPNLLKLGEIARTAAKTIKGRVLIVNTKGIVLADSGGAGRLGADYSSRPEIRSALAGSTTQETRRSETLKEDILATAVPVTRLGITAGAVRITQSYDSVGRSVRRSVVTLALIGLLVIVLGLAAGWVLANGLARPIRRLEETARRIVGGDRTARAEVEGSTEQRSLALAFNEMTDDLVHLLQVQEQFVSDASHQLRTPLAAIRLRIEEAEELGVSDESRAELEAALGEHRRIAEIINDLLLLGRAGTSDAPIGRIDLEQACARALDRWLPIAAEQDLALVVGDNPPGGRAFGYGREADLDRALDAVLENAVRYSRAPGMITITVLDGAIAVDDAGPGLAPGEEERIFERFHRGAAGIAVPTGTGLGLAIARQLMRSFGGEVSIANRPGGGARALLELTGDPPPGGDQSPTLEP